MSVAPQPTTYVFADEAGGASHHGELVSHLAAILDPFTTRRLEPDLPSSGQCLEIGAGAGTIARWLADRVGPDGEVIATDLDPQHIPSHPNLTVLRHDIATEPLEPAQFDLIHARLVLAHLPNRYQVLHKLVDALTPGGVLVVDEFAAGGWDRCVLDTPDPRAAWLFARYHEALVATMESAGTDTGWGRAAHPAMRRAGLIEVEADFWTRSWHGGEPGCMLPYAASAQLRPRLIEAGMSEADIDAFRELLTDPRLVIHSSLAVSTSGRKA